MAQYLRLYSCLFQTTVHLLHFIRQILRKPEQNCPQITSDCFVCLYVNNTGNANLDKLNFDKLNRTRLSEGGLLPLVSSSGPPDAPKGSFRWLMRLQKDHQMFQKDLQTPHACLQTPLKGLQMLQLSIPIPQVDQQKL